MKKLLSLALIFLLSLASCSANPNVTTTPTPDPLYQKSQPFGTVPREFLKITSDNTFNDGVAFSDRVLKYTEDENSYTVVAYDLYGKVLSSTTIDKLSNRDITALTATSDGGFLVTVGFRESYLVSVGKWASELGVSSKIIKCNQNGDIIWERELEDLEDGTLEYCIEKDGSYYFFGEIQTPETKVTGVYSPTDIHILKLDSQGKTVESKLIGGSDYDTLYYAQDSQNGFTLYTRSQSKNGNSFSIDTLTIELSADLEELSKENTEAIVYPTYLGVIGGKAVSTADVENMFDDTIGHPELIIDYGDFYLMVSDNPTDIYNKLPLSMSSLLFYWETVYSAYDKDGKLIWRTAVDSTPDYDQLNGQLGNLPIVAIE
ncbi:MAG: hypothetical protein E7675_04150 [Ruminococcaceae bacterium]|nr:hypothetical protein [Oscillospiraceae bacterium]